MKKTMLSDADFTKDVPGWSPISENKRIRVSSDGVVASGKFSIAGQGVHTRNGDSIELVFRPLSTDKGVLQFGFVGGITHAFVEIDFLKRKILFSTSDCRLSQPICRKSLSLDKAPHSILIERNEGAGKLVRNSDVNVFCDAQLIFQMENLDVMPELGVFIDGNEDVEVQLLRFSHYGRRRDMPEYLHLGGWQMLNDDSLRKNVEAIKRGVRKAAGKGIELLVTPETSLTGLFPAQRLSNIRCQRAEIKEAETVVRKYLSRLENAPHLIMGMPEWREDAGHGGRLVRYNVSRLYAPDGSLLRSCAKINSCENGFWHGYKLNEFDVCGVPCAMHICHDGTYTDVWNLPSMFGARLHIRPANGKLKIGTLDLQAMAAPRLSNSFYIKVNGDGGSFISSPAAALPPLALSDDCDVMDNFFVKARPARECMIDCRIRLDDAFAYWPKRLFRASEQVAAAYVKLYKAWGGSRSI